jgi:hypothetical protein
VFLSVWPVRAGAAMWASFASALRAMADLARVGSRSDDQTVVAREIQGLRLQAYRHFATAQQSVEEEAFEWTASGADVAAARDRFQAATAEAQSVFLTQLAVASQRPNVAPSELPEGLVTGARRFDAVVAESLDVIADRAETAATRDPPDLRLPLAAVTGVMRAEIPRIANPEVVVQVEGRLALYRELVPRLERLGSGGLIG